MNKSWIDGFRQLSEMTFGRFVCFGQSNRLMFVYPFSVPSQIICSINDTTKVMIGRIEFAVFEDLIEFYKK